MLTVAQLKEIQNANRWRSEVEHIEQKLEKFAKENPTATKSEAFTAPNGSKQFFTDYFMKNGFFVDWINVDNFRLRW